MFVWFSFGSVVSVLGGKLELGMAKRIGSVMSPGED